MSACAPPHRLSRLSGADLSASVAVFLIALPLSLGIALATGAPLESGLVAAAVGGIVAGAIGGAPLQVSGPAAGLTVVTAELIHRYGWRTTCAITVLAGLAQIGLSCLRVARTALAVSPAVVHGMLAGIGVTIAVAQLHIVLGGTPQSSVLANLRALPAQLTRIHPGALLAAALTLAVLTSWPRLPGRLGRVARRLPAALVAVATATVTTALFGLRLPVVNLPSWSSHALAGLPDGPVLGIAAAVLTTTLVCSVQSLLGAVAVDKLATARPDLPPRMCRSDLNRELFSQGAANVVSGALGGLPVAGVVVRSTANVKAGAKSGNSAVLHGVWVVAAMLLLVPVLELVPLASLAALVMAVGIRMVSLHHIRTVTRHREVLVYGATILGVVLLGVLEGVGIGVAVAVAVALHRLAHTRITHEEDKLGAHHVRVRGQLTFLAVPRLSRTLHQVPHGARCVVELSGSYMDHAAYEALQDWRKSHTGQGGEVEIAGRAGNRGKEPIAEDLVSAHSGTVHWGAAHSGAARSGAVHSGAADAGAMRSAPAHSGAYPAVATASPVAPGASRGMAEAGGVAEAGGMAEAVAVSAAATAPTTPAVPMAAAVSAADSPGSTLDWSTTGPMSASASASTPNPAPAPVSTPTSTSISTPTSTSTPTLTPTSTPTPASASAHPCCRPWTPWWNHRCGRPGSAAPGAVESGRGGQGQLARGINAFLRDTAPHVRGELARLAREGQKPTQLFLTCADSRVVTSMITASGPGDLFVVRNVGNLVPAPGSESGDDSVAAAIEYAVDVLEVQSITVCGHSGCGAMQALLAGSGAGSDAGSGAGSDVGSVARTPLARWLRHGVPSLERTAVEGRGWVRLAGRAPADAVEQLCLTNVVQQLDHLRAHESVARALRERRLELHGMYFHVGDAQAYLLRTGDPVFAQVEAEVAGIEGLREQV
ncbi:bifunctional SulP family inorganic anion transporter/carbonic anhydrase [Streptomyces beihaiensis]|uniref:SulP family inorganic anion transporter n=1 Tax=Streptomyces beihaiensis TaxID=2984495 RepID=A0ABT3TS35_9ACTN|nr:SulP family inorganic anion transporter [Streptomyces beihaiensis]MCX3059822.1 SulP family inorganic anion transporter [Streptomyces beihaiensis]